MRHLRHLVPVEARRVADRLLELRRIVAVGDDVEPKAVATVLGDAALVGREQDRAGRCAKPLHLDQAQLAGSEIEARDVVAQVLLGDVVDLPALRLLVLHDHAHGGGLGLEVRLETPHLGRLALGVRQHEDAREPLDCLERERPLAIEVDPAALAAGKQLRVARLGLREPPLGAGELLLHVGRRAADLLVRALEQLGERKLDVGADPVDLGEAILACLLEERCERVLVEPGRRLGKGRDRGHLGRRVRGREVAEQAGLLEPRFAVLGDLHREEPLVDDLPESIHDARPVEVDARRALVLERVEGRALAEDVERLRVGVPPDRLEERMAGRDPLQLLRLGRLAVGGAARIAVREGRELPVRVLLVAAEDRGCARRLEGVRQARDWS